jgi:hypothetical protein
MPTVSRSLNPQEIEKIRTFLAPEPEGRGYFDNFVIENRSAEPWGLLGSGGHLEGQTRAHRLFDLWQLMATVLPEAAGVNRNHILFAPDEPLSEVALAPEALRLPRALFYEIADQLADLVRELDPRMPIVSNGAVFMENLPRLTD